MLSKLNDKACTSALGALEKTSWPQVELTGHESQRPQSKQAAVAGCGPPPPSPLCTLQWAMS